MPVTKKGFTLIELLVVIAIIGLLSSVVLASLNTARGRARDAQRKSALSQLAIAAELTYLSTGQYPVTAGYFDSTNPGLIAALTPTSIARIPQDPLGTSPHIFQYWRHEYSLTAWCSGVAGTDANKYGFYASLENPSASDLAAFTTPYDRCIRDTWGMNYKKGN